mmetsp:Transcript_45917/g.85735  ORF Transcript_45917/g.85735 Transcript_45917/m.85735 type:complete len:1044 (+) Transcript_45917:91-3222(+)
MGTMFQNPVAPRLTSASGLLALLEEDNDTLKGHALRQLISVVDQHWPEVAGALALCEALYEDEGFEARTHAALLASKVFYHLGELNDSLTYALGAEGLFDVNQDSEYVQTLVAKCIDEYIEQRVRILEAKGNPESEIDPRLASIVERMFERCFTDGQYHQAIGIALESHRIDMIERAISQTDNRLDMLSYTMSASLKLVTSREFRQKVLRSLVNMYKDSGAKSDYVSVCTCLMFLDDANSVATILDDLILGTEDEVMIAYQIAFDLFENEIQQFLLKVRDQLAVKATPPAPPTPIAPAAPTRGAPAAAETPAAEPAEDTQDEAAADAMDTDGEAVPATPATPAPATPATPAPAQTPAVEATPAAEPADVRHRTQYQQRWNKLSSILSGETPIGLHLQFLSAHTHADLLVLKQIKDAVETRNSVCHSATILANALMHAGTTVDTFLRENLDWLARATNWAKFSATAGLGVIHRGHLSQGRALMEPYLPRGNSPSVSPYSEGGALYALGLIHVDHGEGIRQFLLESLRNTSNETIQHGACLGLGLAGLGTTDAEVYEDMKGVLYSDSAVAGEAAGIGMGLLLAGTASDKSAELLTYAHDTQHEKIIRGLALGCALVMYGREEEADTLIEQLCQDADPILRYGGMYAVGLAYRGTANNSAIRRLLHFAVSDVSDDVRRAAVMCLGFVLYQTPEQCPRVVSLLAESYNPHMRYGAALAVGIACSGTGLKEAISLLEPLTSDAVDYVRQGALIAMAMVLVQQTESRVSPFRKQLDKVIQDKHEDTMCKMGAIMASGLLDAGGRNVTIGLRSRSGNNRMAAVIGMAVFTQYWYWYPLSYFISLPLAPTVLVGLNADLKMPQFTVTSQCRPSMFAYPPPITPGANQQVAKAPTAILSTTAKARAKAKRDASKEAKGVDTKPSTAASASRAGGDAMDTTEGGAAAGKKEEKAAKVEEASFEILKNPARVAPAQQKFIQFQEGDGVRYQPMKKAASGIVMLKDLRPDLPVELAEVSAPARSAANPTSASQPTPVEEEEPPPPAPFEYVPTSS